MDWKLAEGVEVGNVGIGIQFHVHDMAQKANLDKIGPG